MSDRVSRALLIVIPAALRLACWPFVDMPVNDDFAYAFTVKRLLEDGRFAYGGWSEGILGAQAFWGLAFTWVFGFSHNVLRVSMLPLSIGCGLLAYGLYRRLGSDVRWSLLAALVLVTSPIFTPWSASFMTDVPGLLFLLLLLHVIVLLRRAMRPRELALPLLLLALVGLAGGSVRQSVLALAGVAMLLEGWRWRDRGSALALVVLCIAAYSIPSGAMLAWASQQPYRFVAATPPIREWTAAATPLLRMTLDGVLFTLPLIIALLPYGSISRRCRLWMLAVVAIAGGACIWFWPHTPWFAAPWLGNSVTPTGLLDEHLDAAGNRPVVIPSVVAAALAVLVFGVLVLALQWLWRQRRTWPSMQTPRSAEASAIVVFFVLSAVYIAALIPRAGPLKLFDRYLLVLLPIASAALLHGFRTRIADRRPGVAAWSLVALFAIAGVVFTFDHFAELRARVALAAELERDGIPAHHISNGFSADAWQQLSAAGYLNDSRITIPTGAFDPNPIIARRADIFWFLRFTPVVEPRWVIINVRGREDIPPSGRAYRFRTILRPWGRWIVAYPLAPSVSRESDGR